MRKVIAALNSTLDGICDHTAGVPDDGLRMHYANLLAQSDVILYGRTTFQLMEFWLGILETPSEDESMNEFARAIDRIPKLVFSRTLQDLEWESATLAQGELKEVVSALKQAPGKDILVGSRSLIIQLLQLGLIDEFQLCIHPLVAGGGLPFFQGLDEQITFKLLQTKTLESGAIFLSYQPLPA